MQSNRPETFDEFYDLLMARKVPFFIVFFIAVVTLYAGLYALDIVPEPVGTNAHATTTVETTATATTNTQAAPVKTVTATKTTPQQQATNAVTVSNAVPIKIIFDTMGGKEVTILNPKSDAIADLDTALLSGAIRHPDSADFKNVGNIFLLGHSSYLPVVHNKNYQAFNGIQNLTWGDTIRLLSIDTEYTYRVEKVYKTTADQAVVQPTPGKAKLTLATCNSFATKNDRYMVEASLISSKPL